VPEMLTTLGRLDEAQGDRRGVPNWLSTHPDPLSRVDEIRPVVEMLKAGRSNFATNRDEFLRHIDGIIYGDNPDQGIVRGSTFLHPPLRFRVDFPQGWDVLNSPQQVIAKAPGAEVYMLLEVVQQPNGRTVEEIAVNQMRNAGFRAVSGERTTINGRDAFVGVYQGQLQDIGSVTMRAAHIQHGTSVYMLAGFTSPNTFQQADNAFIGAIRSFRPLSAAEAENIRPNRVDLYVVRQGDSWASIAERSGGVIKPATLAVMNHATASSQPQPGARIKIVVGG
jgi:predicted Zn-dependent protease